MMWVGVLWMGLSFAWAGPFGEDTFEPAESGMSEDTDTVDDTDDTVDDTDDTEDSEEPDDTAGEYPLDGRTAADLAGETGGCAQGGASGAGTGAAIAGLIAFGLASRRRDDEDAPR